MKLINRIFILSVLIVISPARAVEQIEVQALMPGMVVLLIDGDMTTLKTGEKSLQGIKLISSSTQLAILEINGEQKSYRMGTTINTHFTKRETLIEQIIIDKYGMFRAYGSINGQSVKFLIDTGASSVAISARDARKLGIQYRLAGRETRVNTASGTAKAWAIKLKKVRLGKLVEHNIEGVVVDGDYPSQVLLGMTFLNRMKVEKEGNKMIISRKK